MSIVDKMLNAPKPAIAVKQPKKRKRTTFQKKVPPPLFVNESPHLPGISNYSWIKGFSQ